MCDFVIVLVAHGYHGPFQLNAHHYSSYLSFGSSAQSLLKIL